MNLYDPNAEISQRFRLKDLSPTNQSLNEANLPSASYMYDNLVTSAEILEYLEQQVGPFKILSGFRTKELQDKLSSQGEPTSAGLSFHEVGRGFDISPTSMSIDEFFGKMLANPELKSQFAEIAIKPSQNSIHFGVNVPGDIRETKVLGLDENDSYGRLSLEQLARYVEPILGSANAAMDYAAAQLVTYNRTPLILAMVAAFGGVAFLALARGSKSRVARNPRKRIVSLEKGFYHLSDKALKSIVARYRKNHKAWRGNANKFVRYTNAYAELKRRGIERGSLNKYGRLKGTKLDE